MMRMPIEFDDDEPITAVRHMADRTARGLDATRLVQLAWALWSADQVESAQDAAVEAVSVWVSRPEGVDEEDLLLLVEEACGSDARAITETIRNAGALAAFASAW